MNIYERLIPIVKSYYRGHVECPNRQVRYIKVDRSLGSGKEGAIIVVEVIDLHWLPTYNLV